MALSVLAVLVVAMAKAYDRARRRRCRTGVLLASGAQDVTAWARGLHEIAEERIRFGYLFSATAALEYVFIIISSTSTSDQRGRRPAPRGDRRGRGRLGGPTGRCTSGWSSAPNPSRGRMRCGWRSSLQLAPGRLAQKLSAPASRLA